MSDETHAFNLASWLLDDNVSRRPEQTAVLSMERDLTYRQVFDETGRVQAVLQDLGMAREQRVLLVGVGDEVVALPLAKVERITEVPSSDIEGSGGEAFTMLDDDLLLVLDLARQISIATVGQEDRGTDRETPGMVPLVVTEVRGERVALRVDRFVGREEIYVKPVSEMMSGVRVLAGLTMLDDGRPVFLLDLNHLA